MRAIIACAGTAGHINPGLAIANIIKENDENANILFIGTERGLEQDLVPRAGYKLRTIEAYGLSKKISFENLKNIFKTLLGFSQAKKIIKSFEPDVVIGTGGYICGAVIYAAHKLKVPTMLHESNAFPGKAVTMLAKKTDTIMVSFSDAMNRIPKANRVVLTGTPTRNIRKNLSVNDKIREIEKYGLNPAKPTVLIFGGSQGAKKLNDTVVDLVDKKLNKKYQILLVAGKKLYEEVIKEMQKRNLYLDKLNSIKVEPYIYEMAETMNAADIMVCRSGATTITELTKLGKPSILVPLPNVSNNHQQYNAEVLEKIGAARIIKNDDLTAEILNEYIEGVLDGNNTKIMGQMAKSLFIPNVENKIYEEIETLVNKGN